MPRRHFTETGIFNLSYSLYKNIWSAITSRYPIGTNVFSKEWDALIVLDTCRVDALKQVASEYDFLTDIGSITSVGSTSSEWIANTFTEKYIDDIRNTVYVAGNSHADFVLKQQDLPPYDRNWGLANWRTVSSDQLLHLDRWEDNVKHPEGHRSPVRTTDQAIAVGREFDFERFIVHYAAPHDPYTANAVAEEREELHDYEEDPFLALKSGKSFDLVWESYIDHLRYALDNVERLLDNLDAETVYITADHGEGFGEWGIYGHGVGAPSPHVKRVPWAKTTATDTREYDPGIDVHDVQQVDSDSAEEILEDLGYL